MKSSSRFSILARSVIALAVSALLLSGCTVETAPTPTKTQQLSLKVGALLPRTGAFSSLNPPETAGITLAMNEINQAALGVSVDVEFRDSGDATTKTAQASVTDLLSKKNRVSAIVGASSNDVSQLVVKQVTGAGVVMVSPQNDSTDFTTLDDHHLYWRTAPSEALEGAVLAQTMQKQGATRLGLIVLDNNYGVAMSRAISTTFEAAGGSVVATKTFAAADADLSAQVAAIAKAKPDAVGLVTLGQAATLIPALIAAGIPAKQLYLVDSNLAQYGATVPVSMEGVTGTAPGPVLDPFFQKRLAEVDPTLSTYAYAPESYDAVVLLALAALAANSTDGAKIAAKLQQVSGGSGKGEKATDFASAAQIILDGDVVDYDGYSGKIGFDKNGDPAQATIGVFRYGADNTFKRLD